MKILNTYYSNNIHPKNYLAVHDDISDHDLRESLNEFMDVRLEKV